MKGLSDLVLVEGRRPDAVRQMLLIARSFSPAIRRLFLAQAFAGIGLGVFMVLLNLYLRAAGFSEDIIGKLLAFQSFSAAGMSIPMGYLADSTSRRTTYILGILLYAAGMILMLAAESQNVIFGSFLLSGSGMGAMMVSVQPYLQENSRRRQRQYVFSLNFTLHWLTSVFAGLLAGWLPRILRFVFPTQVASEILPLKYSLLIGIGFSLLATLPAMGMNPGSGKGPGRKLHQPGQAVEEEKSPWSLIGRFMLCNALIGGGAGMIVPYFNLYFRDWVGASIPQIGFVFALGQFGTALGSVSSPFLAKRVGPVTGVAMSQLLSLPFMLIMAFRREFWVCAVCFIFRGAFMNMGIPMRQAMMMELIPERLRARASALDSMAWNISWAASMFFSGNIIKNWGYDYSLFIAFGCYLASATSYRFFFRDYDKASR